jgi:mannose-6-phosphate isomerase-like protein (cupin superfamily)
MKHTHATAERDFEVLLATDTAQAAVMTVAPGETVGGPDNRHPESDQWLYVVDGTGHATVEGTTVALDTGDLLCIEAGEGHSVTHDGEEPLETLSLYAPPRGDL